MANEAISYKDFRKRALKLNRQVPNDILAAAWEFCAWSSTLTDRHIMLALVSATRAALEQSERSDA